MVTFAIQTRSSSISLIDSTHRYICEISPPKHRGPLASMVQVLITLGLMLGYFTCYGTIHVPSSLSWRLPIALQSGIAAVLTLVAFFKLPHSPRWLTYKGRHAEATAAWDALGVSGAKREKDSLLGAASVNQADIPGQMSENIGFRQRWLRNLNTLTGVFGKSSRKQMLLACFMMSMQQLSGIDGVLFVCISCSWPFTLHVVSSKNLQNKAHHGTAVCAPTFPTSRPIHLQGVLPRLRRLRRPYLCNHHSRFPSQRPHRPPCLNHLRRFNPLGEHGAHRLIVRFGKRPRNLWCR